MSVVYAASHDRDLVWRALRPTLVEIIRPSLASAEAYLDGDQWAQFGERLGLTLVEINGPSLASAKVYLGGDQWAQCGER